MQIIDNKALLLKVRNPGKITTVIPKSKALDDNQVLVHWNLEEAQVLKNLQIKNVPSPILGRYNWPGRYKPFDHQKTTASFLTLHRRAFCLSEQGTGKTGSVIWAADYLMSIGKIKRALIICPLSIMDSAWRADLFNFAMHRKVDIAHGSRDKRKAVINSDAEFVIINYDGVNIVEEDIKKAGFDLLIVDECFVEGTKVDTPSGYREIQTLAAGDEVFTSDGVKRIKRLVRNTSTTLVDVRLSNGQTITCTREHPFFTDVGWVTAENLIGRRLVSKDELSNMRDGISGKEGSISMAPEEWSGNRVDLLSILRSEEISHTKSGGIVLQPHETRGTGEPVGGSAFGDLQAEHVKKTETDRPQACGAGRERNWYHTYGAIDKAGSTALLGMELPSSVGEEARRLSHELQARFCKSGIENRAGSGWEQPRHECKENPRSEEGSKIIGTWVESVTHKEQGRGTPVFNLEVEGTPNYYVGDGYLVHNCNAYKNCQTTRWKVLNRIITPDTWLWMMTGTPAAQSPVDAYGLAKLVNPNSVPQFFTSFKDMVMQKVSTFRWTIRPNADKIVYEALQPAIRFTKEECLDLPEMTYVTRIVELTPQQKKYYEALRNQLVVQAAGEQITAVNAAVGLNKLLQISCIAHNTPVLTEFGWIPIQHVTPLHRVWDGEEWVRQDGSVFRGEKEVGECYGVNMTSDHRVLTTAGWQTAEDIIYGKPSKRFNRAEVRVPDSYRACWNDEWNFSAMRDMAVPVRLWSTGNSSQSIFENETQETSEELWVPSRQRNTQNEQDESLFKLHQYATKMSRSIGQRLQKLRGTGDYGVSQMVRLVRYVLVRYGAYTQGWTYSGQDRQQRPIFTGELQMGYTQGTGTQHAGECSDRYAEGENNCSASSRGIRTQTCHLEKTLEGGLAYRFSPDAPTQQKQKTYDLLNCGPRSRFVVAGKEGPIIVHNCGTVYADSGETIQFDISNRYKVLKEVIDETNQKILVFVPFKHTIEMLREKLIADGFSAEVINGEVSAGKRTEIFKRFQSQPDPRILIIQPQAAAHGVTLTAADTIVWWGPTSSLEIYAQANARAHRAGQRHPVTVVKLQGSNAEKHVYKMLEGRIDENDKLIDLYKNLLD